MFIGRRGYVRVIRTDNWTNPPLANNMGGVWERQIRSAQNILNSLLKTHGASLTDESLQTLLTEVEAIVNSRPLTTDVINDVTSPVSLSPINLLTMESRVVLPQPSVLSRLICISENTGDECNIYVTNSGVGGEKKYY